MAEHTTCRTEPMRAPGRRLTSVIGVLAVIATTLALASGAAPVGAAPDAAAPWSSSTLELDHGGIAYDAARDRLLVSVSPGVSSLGNKVVEIDPRSGTVGRSVAVGSTPGVIATSDDGSRAYVGLGGAPAIAEIDLATFTVTRTFVLGSDSQGSRYAEDIEVQPGNPDVIAVSMRNSCCSPRHEGVAIFDDGVIRASVTGDHTGANRIEFGADPGTLYGYNNETSSFGFYSMTVDGDGVRVDSTADLITGYGVDIEYGGGYIHSTTGLIIDPVALAPVGTYGAASGRVAFDESQGAAYLLSGGGTIIKATPPLGTHVLSTTVPDVGAYRFFDAADLLVASSGSAVQVIGADADLTDFELPPPPPSAVLWWATEQLDVAGVVDLVPHPDGQRLFGVIGDSAPTRANQVVEVDIATRTVTRDLQLSGGPRHIDVSDDGSRLIVGYGSPLGVTEVDVATLAPVRTTYLGNVTTIDLDFVPGHADRYIVANDNVGDSGHHMALVVGGVAKSMTVSTTSAEFMPGTGDLFGYDGSNTGYYFRAHGITDTGLATLAEQRRLFSGFWLDLVADGDRIYSSGGHVVDPVLFSTVAYLGTAGIPVPVAGCGRVLLVSGTSIHEFDDDSFTPIASVPHGGSSAADAVLVGSEVVIATAGELRFVPVGEDTRTVPGAPTGVTATAGNGSATVSWTAPADNGGSTVEQYTVVAAPGGRTCTAAGTSCTVVGLANGLSHTFTVVASNGIGSGPASAPSDPVMPIGPPAAPHDVQVVVGDGQVEVSWSAPFDSGSPITGYEVISQPGGNGCTTAALSCTIDGLTNGLDHQFAVKAENAVGQGPRSAWSGGVLPTSCTTGPGAGAGPFTDVGAAAVFCADIEWAVAHGITTGYADGSFLPGRSLSRQVYAAFLYRFAGIEGWPAPPFPSFVDVLPSHGFYLPIEWMVATDLANGFADGRFRPTLDVSRGSLAAILYRFAGSPAYEPPTTPSFSDVGTGHPFFREIEWLNDVGVTGGFADQTFRPDAPITRQTVVAFLHRFDGMGGAGGGFGTL